MADQYASIIIDISHEDVDRVFQYRIPPALLPEIRVGVQVCVPFGSGNRTRNGYVVELTDRPDYDKEKIKETIDDLVASINTRVAAIRQDYDNIAAYNQAMVESDSLTESYEFVFYQNPENRVLSDLNMQQLYRLGGPLGIFVHLFIKKDVFYGMGDLAEELVESSEGIYLLQDGSLLKRAKEFVSENLIKHKD